MDKPLTHDKALQAAMQEYGRYIRQGEGSTKAVERAIEIYNYVNDSSLQPTVDKYMHNHKHIEIMPGQMEFVDCGDIPIHRAIPLAPLSDIVSVWEQEVDNLRKQVKSLMDAVAILGKRNSHAMVLLERVAGKEIGIHRQGDIEPYYTSWNDGEYWIKQALSYLKDKI